MKRKACASLYENDVSPTRSKITSRMAGQYNDSNEVSWPDKFSRTERDRSLFRFSSVVTVHSTVEKPRNFERRYLRIAIEIDLSCGRIEARLLL